MSDLWDVRDATNEDLAFVKATFLRGLYYGDSWYSQIPKDIFMTSYGKIAELLWNSPKIKVRVALKDDSNIILGYSVLSADGKAVVWVFVKSAWRKQGIAKTLLPKELEYATHLTTLGQSLMKEKHPNMKFNPFY